MDTLSRKVRSKEFRPFNTCLSFTAEELAHQMGEVVSVTLESTDGGYSIFSFGPNGLNVVSYPMGLSQISYGQAMEVTVLRGEHNRELTVQFWTTNDPDYESGLPEEQTVRPVTCPLLSNDESLLTARSPKEIISVLASK